MGLAKSGPKPYLWTHDRRFPHIRRLYRPSHLSRRGCGRPAPDGGGVVRAGFPELFERHGRGFRFGRRRGGAGTPGACARRAARRCGSVPGAGDALLPGRPRTLPARAMPCATIFWCTTPASWWRGTTVRPAAPATPSAAPSAGDWRSSTSVRRLPCRPPPNRRSSDKKAARRPRVVGRL